MVDIIKGILCTCRSPCLSIHPSRKFAESLLKRAPPRITKFISRGKLHFGSQNDTNIKITLSLPSNTFRNSKFTLESPPPPIMHLYLYLYLIYLPMMFWKMSTSFVFPGVEFNQRRKQFREEGFQQKTRQQLTREFQMWRQHINRTQQSQHNKTNSSQYH